MSAITEGEFWSWTRSVMSQGASIQQDYMAGRYLNYEAYSARLDAAAAHRSEEMLARLDSLQAAASPGGSVADDKTAAGT